MSSDNSGYSYADFCMKRFTKLRYPGFVLKIGYDL